MNNGHYRLVFSKLRRMLIAVAETAIGHGKARRGAAGPSHAARSITLSAMRPAAYAALAFFGLIPFLAGAQIVPSGAHAPNVISTANGLPQVNITKPSSGGGVSLNTYSQFDVNHNGAILNNSPVNTGTQLAGQISGNPNFNRNDAARIIVNQVNSNNPSQLRGYVEVAGQKAAAVVIANSSGLVVDGGGFINTPRGILTTGNPIIDGTGNLASFGVTGGTITVQGAGLNGSNIDEVDLLARAVRANAAIYGNALNVRTGANGIDYASLTPTPTPTPTPIAGSGAAPAVSIDVSQLGGMYANRITLLGNENGVGVANAGAIVAQAGDLTLTSLGRLVQSGKMTANGNFDINTGGVENTGTLYAQRNISVDTTDALINSNVIASQQSTSIHAGLLSSTGTLGAGMNNDGSVGNAGDLTLSATGQLNATGENVAGGNATLSGGSVNLAGSKTAAKGNVSLTAKQGDLNLANATTSAGGSVAANASGTFNNDQGTLVAGNDATLTADKLSNQGGVISAQGPLVVKAGSVDNVGGVLAANGTIAASVAGDWNNTRGTTRSLASVSLVTGGAITNTSGKISAAHDLDVRAATLTGGGTYSAAHDVEVTVDGDFTSTPAFRFNAGHDLALTLPGTFTNAATLEAAGNLDVYAGDIGNSGAMMAGDVLTTHSNTLKNAGVIVGGSVSLNATQTVSNVGTAAMIGATRSNGTLELLALDIENRDDTTSTDTQATTAMYGRGKVVLAGGKDANGHYTKANLIRNQSALIQSSGDMALHASQVTNTRRAMTTDGAYIKAVDPALIEQLGISMSGCTATYVAACGPGHPQVMGSRGDLSMIGGVPTDPPHGGQWNSTYQYTTYKGVALANLVTAISPQAQIVAGGKLDASNVSRFENDWSAVAAVGAIAMPAKLDQDSWRGQLAPGVQLTYSGQYHYDNYDKTEHNWQLPFGNAGFVTSRPGGYAQAAPADIRTYALPSYESSFDMGGALAGKGVSINNIAGNAGIPSLGLKPGQSVGSANVDGDPVDSVIASATAVNVLTNLTLPQGGLFRPDTAPNAPYLIETNPAFTSQTSFISSDYYLEQLGLNPQAVAKRLGDGLYEQQLVQNQLTSLTGKAVLGPYTDTQSMYEALMAGGASLAGSLDLPLGMSLSPDQVAALTRNVIIMQTEVVNGQSVLVPVVYLAKASQQNMHGPLIAATDIDLQNAQTFNNSGTVQASNTLSIQGQQIDNAFGALTSGGLMSLTTTGKVDLTSATVSAGSLALNAGSGLILNTAVNTVDQTSETGATRTTTTLGPLSNLNVAGDAAIATGGNFEQRAGELNVGGSLGMSVGGNWDLGSVQTGEHKVVERANGVSDTTINQTTGSTVNVGGVSEIDVGGKLRATGATLKLGGGGVIAAEGDVTLEAAKAISTVDSNSSGGDSHGSYAESLHRSDETLRETTLNAGDALTVSSGKNLSVIGSTINLDKGAATLSATNNVTIGAATETHVDDSQERHSHSNGLGGKDVASSRDTMATLSQGSTVSADAVSISSGTDIGVAGSTIVGTNDVSLGAGHDLNIETTQDSLQSSGTYEEAKSGLGTSGLSVTIGTHKTATTEAESSVTNNASVVGSLNGNVSIHADNTLHVKGSDLVAAQNIVGTGANVVIDSATDIGRTSQTEQTSSSGLSIGLSGSIGDAINAAYRQGHALASGSSNGRADALHAIAAGGNAMLAGRGAYGMATNGMSSAASAPSIAVQLSVGSSRSSSQSAEDRTSERGSNVQAGGNAAFVATGDGTAGSGNVAIAGSNVSANDVVLAAKHQIDIVNTTNTDVTQSSNRSSSASVGVSFGTNGFGVSASMAKAHGDGNSNAVIQNASHITGADSVTVISGGDTNLIGAQVNGGRVMAEVGGSLTIESVQDRTVSTAQQSSVSDGFSISQTGGSASFSSQSGHADGNYAQVNEQAGIQAGSGGFDINVKGNTSLTGAVISSTANASSNSLTTGTLSYSDVQNQSHYDATSQGISAGVGAGNTGKAVGPGSVSGTGGVVPMMSQNDGGDESATTRSAVDVGSISITDSANQTQDLATLSRDTTNANGTVSATPDVNHLLSQQADTMQAAQAAGQVVAEGVGTYANARRKGAQDQADIAKAAGNADLAAQYQTEADSWAEGGTHRAGLHVVGGALIGGLGGGALETAGAGAAGASASATLAGKLNSVADSVGDATGSMTVGNSASNVLAGLGGALFGGSAGAFTASNADLYNRDTTNADGTGGTGSQALDKFRQTGQAVFGWLQDTYGHPIDDLARWGNQFAAQTQGGAQAIINEPHFVQAMQGIANGLNALPGRSGGEPPTTPGMALANSAAAYATNSALGTPGYVPSHVMLNGGSDGQASASNGNISDLEHAANDLFKDGQAITNAGRAATKHPEYFGFDSAQDMRQTFRSDTQLNELASQAVQEILQRGTKTIGAGGRYPNGWVTYTLPDGRAASWTISGEFIGFRGLKK